jgi:hypothetical protein
VFQELESKIVKHPEEVTRMTAFLNLMPHQKPDLGNDH